MSELRKQIEKKAKTHVKSVHGGIAIDLGAKYVLVSDVFDLLADYEKTPKTMLGLEDVIKNQPDPVTGALGYVFDGDQIEEWIKRIEVAFAKFKKRCVCIPKKQLEEENDKAKKYLSKQEAKIGFKVTSNLGFWEGYLKRGKELLAYGTVSEESK